MKKNIRSGFYDDGEVHGTENWKGKENWWYGVPGIRMIWHGEWSDPELECDGYVANYYDVENTMYEYAKEDGIDADNDDAFAQYVRDHADDAKYLVTECGTKEEDDDDFIDSGCHGKTKKKPKKPVKSSMSVEELPREALQELKQRYYAEKYDKDLSYGELADIDDIVSDEEVFDEYGGTSFTEDDFFCLANSRKAVKSSMPGKEKGIQAIMDEYGCTREEAIEIMNEEIQNSRKPVKSSMIPDVSDEDLRFFAGIASSALDDVYDLYDRDEDTLSKHGYTTSDIDRAQRIASTIWNIII